MLKLKLTIGVTIDVAKILWVLAMFIITLLL